MSNLEYREEEGIIDVERRRKNVDYILGDPTIFPPELLVWFKRFIEQSGIELPASAIFGNLVTNVGSFKGLPPGMIVPYAASTSPPGALPADGSSVLRATYPRLFEVIGSDYGAADADHFNLPDYRDRTLFGIGTTLTAVTANDGLALGSRGPHHRHTVTDPGHNHSYERIVGGPANIAAGGDFTNSGTPTSNKVTGITVGPTGKPLDTPAYHGVLYVITTG